jgi:hypothetical protein
LPKSKLQFFNIQKHENKIIYNNRNKIIYNKQVAYSDNKKFEIHISNYNTILTNKNGHKERIILH